jgi:hypothetical protein
MTAPQSPSAERLSNHGFINSEVDNGFCRVRMRLEPLHAIFDGAAILSTKHEVITVSEPINWRASLCHF